MPAASVPQQTAHRFLLVSSEPAERLITEQLWRRSREVALSTRQPKRSHSSCAVFKGLHLQQNNKNKDKKPSATHPPTCEERLPWQPHSLSRFEAIKRRGDAHVRVIYTYVKTQTQTGVLLNKPREAVMSVCPRLKQTVGPSY